MSSDLTFNLQVEKVITTSSQMVGWGLRTFRSRGRHLMMVLLKSLVQPHLDYCSQLWSPSNQGQINKLEGVQKSLVNKIWDKVLGNMNYWEKLNYLRLYSQERRRERYQIIFIWKISQGLVSGSPSLRTVGQAGGLSLLSCSTRMFHHLSKLPRSAVCV